MKLSVMDRLTLLGLLPAEGDRVTLRIVRDLRGELSFQEDELTALKLREEPTGAGTQRVLWDAAADQGKEIAIGPRAHTLIADAFAALEKQKKLKLDQLDLYERFAGDVVAS